MYDVIVVGARCAGASLALLLARSGARVLLVDRATFPSDTLNGHYIQAAGVRTLERWGLLDRILSPGCTPASEHHFDFGPIAFSGRLAWHDRQRAFGLAPRRLRLDAMLVEAAVEAGAEVRQSFAVDDLVRHGDQVIGIRGHGRGDAPVVELASIVVGADGFRSRVAAGVRATAYEVQPARTCIYYSYWAGVPTNALTLYARPRRYLLTFPTDDGLTCVCVAWPNVEFARVRTDVEAHFMAEVEEVPALAEQVHTGQRVESFQGMADLPTFLRTPHGPGWALVGDAGCRVDPCTGQGITDAFRDSGLLADALGAGLSGSKPIQAALGEYHRARDAVVLPLYRYTCQLARMEPPTPDRQRLLAALQHNPAEAGRFAGVVAGTVPYAEFYAPDHIAHVVGASTPQAA